MQSIDYFTKWVGATSYQQYNKYNITPNIKANNSSQNFLIESES